MSFSFGQFNLLLEEYDGYLRTSGLIFRTIRFSTVPDYFALATIRL